MSTGRPPIALGLIDDDHQSHFTRLQRRLTPQQALAFERFLSFRSLHLLSWLYRCFPSLEGQLQRGALPAIMRADPVVKMSPSAVHRGTVFDKRRLWVCTDTHLFVFREDGALKAQVAIADIAEVVHLRVAVPVPAIAATDVSNATGSGSRWRRSASASAASALLGGGAISAAARGKADQLLGSGSDEDDAGGLIDGDDGEEGGTSPRRRASPYRVEGLDSLDDPSQQFVAHRPTAVCHALVLRCPGKRDVGAFFGPSSVAASLIVQFILNRRRVAIVNYAIRSGSAVLPPSAAATAAREAVVTRPPQTLSPTELVAYLSTRGIQLKRPPGSATSVTLSAPAVPLITATNEGGGGGGAVSSDVALGATVYHEALREMESNAQRCVEETAEATAAVLVAAHLGYSAVARRAMAVQHSTDAAARRLTALRRENSARYAANAEKLHLTRAEVQRLAKEMLAAASAHSQSVSAVREHCLSSEDRAKLSLTDTSEDDARAAEALRRLDDELYYVESEIAQQRQRVAALRGALPSADALSEEVEQLKAMIAAVAEERAGVAKAMDKLLAASRAAQLRLTSGGGRGDADDDGEWGDENGDNEEEGSAAALDGLLRSPRGGGGVSHSLHSSTSASPLRRHTTPFAPDQHEEVRILEEMALAALQRKREAMDFLAKARIAHGNESILLERSKARCEGLADRIAEAARREREASDACIDLRRDMSLLQRRIAQLPMEALLCEDLQRAQVIEASVERSVRAGASPAGLKGGEAVLAAQLSHLNAIRDRMRSAVASAGSANGAAYHDDGLLNVGGSEFSGYDDDDL